MARTTFEEQALQKARSMGLVDGKFTFYACMPGNSEVIVGRCLVEFDEHGTPLNLPKEGFEGPIMEFPVEHNQGKAGLTYVKTGKGWWVERFDSLGTYSKDATLRLELNITVNDMSKVHSLRGVPHTLMACESEPKHDLPI